MRNFFNTTSMDTINDCLQGEKLLDVSRDQEGNTLLTFESAYPDAADRLTIKPSGEIVGTFACDYDPDAQPVEGVTDMSGTAFPS